MVVATFTKSGARAATPAKLDKAIFEVEVKNHQLLKDVYLSYLANGRVNFAKVKTRGEVRGSTAKPWRQKGTGRARFGSRYNPIWRGGGVAFGPTGQENYSQKINQSAKRTALRQALSLAAQEDKLKVIEAIDLGSGKVKDVLSLVGRIGAKGNILMLVATIDNKSLRATRNIQNLKLRLASNLSVFDVMNADEIVIEKRALEILNERLVSKKA